MSNIIPILTPDIIIEEEAWNKIENLENEILESCKVLAQHLNLAKHIDTADFSVLLTNDQHIKQLNKEYRSQDSATNALSFPTEELHYLNPSGIKILNNSTLGDIVISYETLKKEASEQDKQFINHFKHLLIHSMLHLLGFDHDDDDDAEVMEAEEIKILAQMNISSPYE